MATLQELIDQANSRTADYEEEIARLQQAARDEEPAEIWLKQNADELVLISKQYWVVKMLGPGWVNETVPLVIERLKHQIRDMEELLEGKEELIKNMKNLCEYVEREEKASHAGKDIYAAAIRKYAPPPNLSGEEYYKFIMDYTLSIVADKPRVVELHEMTSNIAEFQDQIVHQGPPQPMRWKGVREIHPDLPMDVIKSIASDELEEAKKTMSLEQYKECKEDLETCPHDD